MPMLTWEERVELAQRFAPRLVLFPEQKEAGRPNQVLLPNRPNRDVGDYHPRSVELLLEHGRLYPGTLRSIARLQFAPLWDHSQRLPATLDHLAKNRHDYDQIRLLGPATPDPDQAWELYFKVLGDQDAGGRRGYDRFPLTTYAHVVTREDALHACQADPKIKSEDYRGKVGRPFYLSGDEAKPDDVVLQYWFCYYFDDWANIHEADWEGISIFLRKDGADWQPLGAAYHAHENGARRHWNDMEVMDNTHPVVYIAAGSHAAYFQYTPDGHETQLSGAIIRRFKLKVGFTVNNGNRDFVAQHDTTHLYVPCVEVLPDPIGPTTEKDPAWRHKKWLSYPGAWGARELGRFIAGGPIGPSQKGVQWLNPFAWSEVECWPDYLVY